MTPEEIYNDIHQYCIDNADESYVKKYSRYFKGGFIGYGLAQGLLEEKANSILADNNINLEFVLNLSKLLLISPKYEETSIAYFLVKKFIKQFTTQTFIEISSWYERGINNWAHSDVISGDFISYFIIKSIIKYDALSDWRTAENKFKRRSVPVSLIKVMKKERKVQKYIDFIEPMMLDPVREVHQGLGWFLREAWKIERDVTEEYLLKWKNSSPRLIFQYACEKMTSEEKLNFKKENGK